MTMLEDDPLQQFLTELTALSKKHNIWIAGCGCCESPVLISTPTTSRYDEIAGNLSAYPDGEYTVNKP